MAKEKLYRVIYKNKGIYSAVKDLMNTDEWHKFLSSGEVSWLTNPGEEVYQNHDCVTLFTEEGFEMFKKHTLPLIDSVVNGEMVLFIPVNYIDDSSYLYRDKYQVIVKKEDIYG